MRAETSRFGPVGRTNTERLATEIDIAAATLASRQSQCLAPPGYRVLRALNRSQQAKGAADIGRGIGT